MNRLIKRAAPCITVISVFLLCLLMACQMQSSDAVPTFETEKYPMEQELLTASIHTDAYQNIGIIFVQDSDIRYFCTPVDAYVFAHTGGDGIHFCTIPDSFGDTVFVVEPMPIDRIHVRPIASDFKEFIRILLAVRYTGLLLDIPLRTEDEFRDTLQQYKDHHETTESVRQLRSLAEYYDAVPIDDPYTRIRSIQDTFDYSLIPFSDEYYETAGIPNPNKS